MYFDFWFPFLKNLRLRSDVPNSSQRHSARYSHRRCSCWNLRLSCRTRFILSYGTRQIRNNKKFCNFRPVLLLKICPESKKVILGSRTIDLIQINKTKKERLKTTIVHEINPFNTEIMQLDIFKNNQLKIRLREDQEIMASIIQELSFPISQVTTTVSQLEDTLSLQENISILKYFFV